MSSATAEHVTEWVMTGVRQADGRVRLYAAREVPEDLEFTRVEDDAGKRQWLIEGVVGGLLIIDGPEYEYAVGQLFQILANAEAERQRTARMYRMDLERREIESALAKDEQPL